MKSIVVIGGGPCGIMASYQIKKNHTDYQVILIDKTSIGKRIKVSGNGRCNFSNENISKDFYYNGNLINDILLKYKSYEKSFLDEINLHYYVDNEGRKYPLTDSSKTVLNKLSNIINKIGVIVKEDECFVKLICNNGKYIVITSNGKYEVDKVIFAIGGCSQLYKAEDYYNVLFNIPYKIKIKKMNSSLCPITVKEKINKNVVGKRAKVKVYVTYLNRVIYQESGEIIFKKDGVSGIVIFNISSFISNRENLDNYKLVINFIDGVEKEDIDLQLLKFKKDEVVSSYVVDEIKDMILQRYDDIYLGLSKFSLTISNLYPLNESQVTRGGISLDELDLSNLSLKKDKNIYFGGEMIDVDGRCGGYNIYFALASGYLIGNSI